MQKKYICLKKTTASAWLGRNHVVIFKLIFFKFDNFIAHFHALGVYSTARSHLSMHLDPPLNSLLIPSLLTAGLSKLPQSHLTTFNVLLSAHLQHFRKLRAFYAIQTRRTFLYQSNHYFSKNAYFAERRCVTLFQKRRRRAPKAAWIRDTRIFLFLFLKNRDLSIKINSPEKEMKTQQSTMEKVESFINGLEPAHFENVSFIIIF